MEGAWYANVLGSVHWEGNIQCGGVYTVGINFFQFIIKINRSKTTKSHMFDMPLKLTNQQ